MMKVVDTCSVRSIAGGGYEDMHVHWALHKVGLGWAASVKLSIAPIGLEQRG
jgi:hypothetical protein